MTTTAIPVAQPRPASSLPWLRHSLSLAGRSVKKMVRHPEQFFDVTLQPVLFLIIFVYVLGGAIAGSTHDYLQFVLPGILIQTVLFSTIAVGVNLNTDIKDGVFDRFRSLPIPRSAPLVGATIAECLRYGLTIVMTMVAGTVMGFRPSTSPVKVLAACLLVLLFAWCMCWVAIWLGMITREAGSVQGIGFLALFPLTFGSSMFASADTMPGWLRAWVDVNPVTHLTDAVRGLLTGGPVAQDALIALGTSGLVLAVFAPLAVRAYRTKA
ncbi:ABC transporter permease [Aeromicrobium chenweiae]|uniref:Transport permease protein n=1 Tax=Aeromicrobium chenweiae TaxID=2079793 RepID=A0A2S0WPU1_9ACTN|nr:ABC transporter permease [Aeromicrobium chenweiae]AWB93300.1 ABC transporter [Aeromicrobium chenweiae]TGN34292.1 ABC transporter permease [Aeromicrobium chenweiae]